MFFTQMVAKMAGDTDVSYCGSCKKLVKDNCEALQCDGLCDLWFHANCVNISSSEFEIISNLEDKIKWICNKCTLRLEKMRSYKVSSEDYLNLHDLVQTLFGLIKSVVKDNLDISKKMDLVSDQVNTITTHIEVRDHELKSRNVRYDVVSQTSSTKRNNPQPSTAKANGSEGKPDANFTPDVSDDDVVILEKTNLYSDQDVKVTDVLTLDVNNIGSNTSEAVISENYLDENDFPPLDGEDKDPWKYVGKKGKSGYATVVGSNSTRPTKKKPIADPRPDDQRRDKRRKNKPNILVGTGEASTLQGTKKAWFHLGKVKKDTRVEDVKNFLDTAFPNIEFDIEKLDTKGTNCSFKLGVDFAKKDEITEVSSWPKNVTLKRFLFRRETAPHPR